MKYKYAVFDLDGTILDTLDDLADSTNAALAQYSFPARTVDEVRQFVGNGIKKLIERAVPPNADDEQTAGVFEYFKTHYKAHCKDKTKPYDGIPELLSALRQRGIKTAVVSNKADFAVKELIDDYFPGLFDFCAGEREGVRRKPAPDTVYEAMKALGADKGSAVYIGDSDVDVMTAKNSGIDCIGVSYGFRGRDFLIAHGAEVIADTVAQLSDMLLQE